MNSYDPVTGSSPSRDQGGAEPQGLLGPLIGLCAIMLLVVLGVTLSASLAAEAETVVVGAGSDADTAADSDADQTLPVGAAFLAPSPQQEADVAADERLSEMVAELEVREEQIAALEEQLGYMRQVLIDVQSRSEEEELRQAELSRETRSTLEASAMEQWRMGYSIGGGSSLSAFENVILPCESGSQPDPDMAVGPTDDWGRAQINRPTWKNRFESLTGASFEENITNPVLNGFMAAHVEAEQGLSAWTCWRKR